MLQLAPIVKWVIFLNFVVQLLLVHFFSLTSRIRGKFRELTDWYIIYKFLLFFIIEFLVNNKAVNWRIWFPSELLVFCPKMRERAIRSKKWAIRSFLVSDLSDSLTIAHYLWATWANRSLPLSDLSESLMVAHFWWATWAIRSHRSFDLC